MRTRTGSDLDVVALTSSCVFVNNRISLISKPDSSSTPPCAGSCRGAARHRRVFHNPAVFELDNTVAKGRVRFRVRHLNDRSALLIQFAEKLHGLLGLAGVEIAGGFVRQDQLRITGHGTCYTD